MKAQEEISDTDFLFLLGLQLDYTFQPPVQLEQAMYLSSGWRNMDRINTQNLQDWSINPFIFLSSPINKSNAKNPEDSLKSLGIVEPLDKRNHVLKYYMN